MLRFKKPRRHTMSLSSLGYITKSQKHKDIKILQMVKKHVTTAKKERRMTKNSVILYLLIPFKALPYTDELVAITGDKRAL
jgi:hypothetical protein